MSLLLFRSQLTHPKTPSPVCDEQSQLLIGRYMTVVRCQGCSWLCSSTAMAISRGKSNKMRKEGCVSATLRATKLRTLLSPGTELKRFAIKPEACSRYCALTRAYPCTLTTVLILAVCCTVSHSARFSLTCTLRQWRLQMTSSTMHRNRRTVLSVKMERSWNGEGTYCVTEDLGLDSRQRLDMFYSLRPDGRWG